MMFDELGLQEPIVRAVAACGYDSPTHIQRNVIPPALAGRDVLGSARTGTGKTGAFVLPILDRLMDRPSRETAATADARGGRRSERSAQAGGRTTSSLRALILAPTRELAAQILESLRTYGRHLPLRHGLVVGGVHQSRQVRTIREGIDVLVATPGRLIDLIGQGLVDLGSVEVLVLDEADRMLDMGFIRDIERICDRVPPKRQTMLLSATMPPAIRTLAEKLLKDPAVVQCSPTSSAVPTIRQWVFHVDRSNKQALLHRVLHRGETTRTIVFARTRHGSDRVARRLMAAGFTAASIHGDKPQRTRDRTLMDFRRGRTSVLVATDVAARGLDVDGITHVINFDLPNDPETYVHRIGRTARAGASGTAISFCDRDEVTGLRSIERLMDRSIEVDAGEADLTLEPAPAAPPRGAASRPRRRGHRSGGNSGAHSGGSSRNSDSPQKRSGPDRAADSSAGGGSRKKHWRSRKNAGGASSTGRRTRRRA